MIRGVLYQSHKEAAEALGVTTSAISQRLRVNGNAETVGLGLKGASIGNTNRAREIKIWDMTFPSRTKAAELLGISRSQLTKWTSPKASKWQQNQLLIHALRYKRERDKKNGR
jgi:predicted transcriptional regulator